MSFRENIFCSIKNFARKPLDLLSDRTFINLHYFAYHKRFPNLKSPQTFNEKLHWYMLYYRDPLMTVLADKYKVRNYIESMGLVTILNELYGVYTHPDEIDFSKLPERFVIKATHGSDMNLICRDKAGLNWELARQTMKGWLRKNYFQYGREWAYKNIEPRLVCERYLENVGSMGPIDYKFFCFDGIPKFLSVVSDRFSDQGVKVSIFDLDWNFVAISKGQKGHEDLPKQPDNLPEMIEVASQLSRKFPFIRVDLYSIENAIVFGECTFYPDGGTKPIIPDKYNLIVGEFFKLP